MRKLISIWSKMFDKIDPDVTVELDEIIYSKKHGHEVCVLRLVGKNIFPIMTPEEILSNEKAMFGLSKRDLIVVTRLDLAIQAKKNKLKVTEVDKNGTVVLEDDCCNKKRYSEKLLSADKDILDKLIGGEAYSIGYRVGLKEGLKVGRKMKVSIKNNILSIFKIR